MDLNKLIIDLEKAKRKMVDNPGIPFDQQSEILNSAGINLTDFSEEELKTKLMTFVSEAQIIKDDLQTVIDVILNKENKNSKAIYQYQDYTKGKELNSEEKEKMQLLFERYTSSEKEAFGKSCFHFDKNACDFIINAHSLQKGGVLKNISKNNSVYQISFNPKNLERIPKILPTNNASTFQGFCHSHDAIFQQTIESNDFNGSAEHCFLHSYRSFAYSYHKIKEDQDYYLNLIENTVHGLESFITKLHKEITQFGLDQLIVLPDFEKIKITTDQLENLKIVRYESYKNKLNLLLREKKYADLEYFIYQVDHKIPIACASWIKSHLHINDFILRENKDSPYHGYPLIVTILPDQKSTVILSRFKSDSISGSLLRKLEQSKIESLEVFERNLSSIILRLIENIFFSPEFWDSQDTYIKDQFLKEMVFPEEDFVNIMKLDGPVNIFSEIYSLKH